MILNIQFHEIIMIHTGLESTFQAQHNQSVNISKLMLSIKSSVELKSSVFRYVCLVSFLS